MYKDEVSNRAAKNGIRKMKWTSGEDNTLSDSWKCHPTYRCQVSFWNKYVDGVVLRRLNCQIQGDAGDLQPLWNSISAG